MAQEHNIKPQSSFFNAMIKARRADDSSEVEELKGKSTESSASEINADDLEEPFDNDECEDAESGGSLAPLHIESAASNYTCTSRMCPCRRSRSFLPSFICHRALLVLAVSTILISLVLAIAKHLYPTYLPSVPSVSIFWWHIIISCRCSMLIATIAQKQLNDSRPIEPQQKSICFWRHPNKSKGCKGRVSLARG